MGYIRKKTMTLSIHNKHKIFNKITFKRTQSPEHGASNKTLLLLICSPSWEIQKLKKKKKTYKKQTIKS
jgi:hypothetical protein